MAVTFLMITVLLLGSLPFVAYLTMKLGVMGYLKGREKFLNQKGKVE